jgi:hypothetical protein
MTKSYFKSNSHIDGSSVTNVEITNSSLDMNAARITSVQDPVLQQDAATKSYVDSLTGYANVSLSSTNYSLVSGKLKGSVQLIVEAVVEDGPCGIFLLSKSKSSKEANIVRQTSSPGDSSNKEQLNVRWNPGIGIELRKTNTGFDGNYKIRDAATTNFLDELNITLTSTNYSLVSDKLKGSIQILVEAIVEDGPSAVFLLSKSKSSKQAHIVRLVSSPGDSIQKERLNVRWSPGLGVELNKNNSGFDGGYTIKIF